MRLIIFNIIKQKIKIPDKNKKLLVKINKIRYI